MENPYRKPYTAIFIIFEKMKNAYQSGNEIEIEGLRNGFDEHIPRSSISMYVNKISKDNFPNRSFYTRTKDEKLYLGCFNPEKNKSDIQSPQEILGILKN